MFNEKKFKFDIENLKQDLAIEDMYVTEEDISLLRDYQEQKITEQDMINKIKKMGKFDSLPDNLKEIAEVREKNPDMSLLELGKLLQTPIGKSGVNHRLKAIEKIAEE